MSTVSATAALQRLHLKNPRLYINEPTASLRSMALARGEGSATQNGSFVATTGKHTGRSTADRFIVQDTTTAGTVWWGSTNQAMAPAQFEALLTDVTAYLNQQPELFVQQCHVGARAASRKNVLCINTQAWHSWFARNMFIPATEHGGFNADFTILHAPDFTATPSRHGCRSGTVIALNIGKGVVIIAGTAYAGEMKKSIFSLMNYWLPEQGILPMHASANTARSNNGGKSAVFFGLSGTGKTTLSTDAARPLIGDDEHGWDDNGLFNFEGGCYAKAVNLSKEAEPEIYATTNHPETLMENVVLDANGNPDFTDTTLTENTRISYPIHALENIEASGTGGHPTAIVMLTCDATGVLPPVSILSKEQALYHFLSGYTAKVAGTEMGVHEPVATFSACFGLPFMPRHPVEYAKLLGSKLQAHPTTCYLLNTGWTGGGYSSGQRISIAATRTLLNAALNGALAKAPTAVCPIFGLRYVTEVAGVNSTLLSPKQSWNNPAAYDQAALKLKMAFHKNMQQYADAAADVLPAAMLLPQKKGVAA